MHVLTDHRLDCFNVYKCLGGLTLRYVSPNSAMVWGIVNGYVAVMHRVHLLQRSIFSKIKNRNHIGMARSVNPRTKVAKVPLGCC